jgi:ketosteroid isomerase-like protein
MKSSAVCACALLVAVVALVGPHRPMSASAQSRSVAEVWALEDDYWRFVKAGDVERYVTLWHEKFIGWPCDQDHPKRKSAIGDWVREVRDKKIKVTSALTREGAEDFGDTVVVHYRFTKVDTYPDGRVEGHGRESKITHTWMRVGNTWQIIGGMCGGLTPAGK